MDVNDKLRKLTGKRFVYFFDSGDDAIRYIVDYLKAQGRTRIAIPDCGGWFSYKKYPVKIGLEVVEIRTADALLDAGSIKDAADSDSIVLINSLGGYFVKEPMKEIADACKKSGSVLVNDISASIGREIAMFGDFCLGSFGEHKPIELGAGGFLASDIPLDVPKAAFETGENMQKLSAALSELDEKMAFWRIERSLILADLKDHEVLHKESDGINIVVAYSSQGEKEKLINYCAKHLLEYKLCPNYIKVNREAVSIELKRLRCGKN